MTSAIHSDLVPRQLTTGVGAPILVVDFVPLSAGGSLSGLLGARSRGHPVYAIDPVSDLVQRRGYVPVADLAGAYAEAFLGVEAACVFVVGYCSAAPLALHIAKRLTGVRDIAVTLVRPVWPDAEEIALEFAGLRKGLGVIEYARPELGADADAGGDADSDGDPEQAVVGMTEVLHGDLVSMATSHGLDPSSAVLGELLNRYRAWLAFLVAGQHAEAVEWKGRSGAVATPSMEILTGTAGDAITPGLGLDDCRISRLPILDQEPFATPELVEILLAQFDADVDVDVDVAISRSNSDTQ